MIIVLIFGFLRWSSVSAFRYQRDREQQCATLYVDVRTYLNQTCNAWWDQRTCNWTIATALVSTSPSLSVSAPVVQVGWKGGRRSILYDPTPDSPTSNQKISSEFFLFQNFDSAKMFYFCQHRFFFLHFKKWQIQDYLLLQHFFWLFIINETKICFQNISFLVCVTDTMMRNCWHNVILNQ